MKVGKYKDGGPLSHVDGFYIEMKRLFSIVMLRFKPGSREAFHSHAFNCISLILGPGYLKEVFRDGRIRYHKPGKILITKRNDFHKVYSIGTTYVFTLRGPWKNYWYEEVDGKTLKLTHHRTVI